MIDLFKSSYTCFLERENAELKEQKRILEERNHSLVMALFDKNLTLPELAPKKTEHKMEKTETSASCSCGWHHITEDPAMLQTAIARHYRENVATPGAKRWTHSRNAAELAAEEEAMMKRERPQ